MEADRSERRRNAALLAGVLLGVLVGYANAFSGDFVWDDKWLIAKHPGVVELQPLASYFGRQFWANPEYADLLESMQRNLHEYIVADKGTAKEALDRIAADWDATFKKYGYRK